MTASRAVSAAVCVLVTAPALAATLRVVIVAADATPFQGSVTATPVCSVADACPAPLAREVSAARDAELPIDRAGAPEWVLEFRAKNCWSPAVRVTDSATSVSLPVWPSTQLRGRLALPKGSAPLASVDVEIASPPHGASGSAVPRTTFRCPVADASFRCAIPAAPLDVRIGAEGFAPRYLWNVAANAVRPVELGSVPLTRGGSISGTAGFAEGTASALTGIEVTLQPALPPLMEQGWSAEEKRIKGMAASVRLNARGFFQFSNVPAGQYLVTARHAGWSAARNADVRVDEDRETRLARAIVLEPLARVEVLVQPPLDPFGKPWKVSLSEMTPLSTMTTPVAQGDAGMSGQWIADGIDGGFHRLDVDDHRGNGFSGTIIEVTPRMPPVIIPIAAVGVRGTVAIGDDPVAARLQFRNGKGAMVTATSDDDGLFAAALPVEGSWEIQVGLRKSMTLTRRVDVRRGDDGFATIELELPATRINGTVVTREGSPASAVVSALDESNRVLGVMPADEKGRFTFWGLDPGSIRLRAESLPDRSSDTGLVPVELEADRAAEVTMTLRRQTVVRGWVVTPGGAPVAGAIIRWINSVWRVKEEVTGPGGTFVIRSPHDVAQVTMAVLPPAMPIRLLSIPIAGQGDQKIEIVVGGPPATLEVEMESPAPAYGGPFPWIRRGTAELSVLELRYPPNWTDAPRGFRPWGMALELEPGEYAVCNGHGPAARCERRLVPPGTVQRVNAKELFK